MPYVYDYPRPMVCTDVVIMRGAQAQKQILLIKRLNEPFKDCWALPGGFVDANESLPDAARRELAEETGLTGVSLTQFKAYGNPRRDPRGHCISVVFYGTVGFTAIAIAGDDAKQLAWFNLDNLPLLAFDHDLIIADVLGFLA